MMPISEREAQQMDLSSYAIRIPEDLQHSLIGDEIRGTAYFMCSDDDPTKAGYTLLDGGTPLERKMYRTRHCPDVEVDGKWVSSGKWYRKIHTLSHGEVWELED